MYVVEVQIEGECSNRSSVFYTCMYCNPIVLLVTYIYDRDVEALPHVTLKKTDAILPIGQFLLSTRRLL
jgi:hypothetical protein